MALAKKNFINLPSTPQLRNAFYFTGQYLPMVEIMIDGQIKIIWFSQKFGVYFNPLKKHQIFD